MDVDFLGSSFFDNFLTVIKLELGHEIALVGRLQAGEDRKHGSHFQRMWRDMGPEVGVADDFLVDLHFFGQAQIIRYPYYNYAVENGLVGVVCFELLPFRFIGVGDDHRVYIHQTMTPRRRHNFLLGRGDHAVEIFNLVFEDFDELDNAAIADVERAIELQDARIAFGVEV